MKIYPNKLKNKLFSYLKRDTSNNAILLYDIEMQPEKTNFIVAEENKEISGAAVLWKDNPDFYYIHIRAEDKHTFSDLLSCSMNTSNVRYVIPSEFSSMASNILDKQGIPWYLMNVKMGNEKILIPNKVSQLSKENLLDIKELFSEREDFSIGMMKALENAIEKEIFFGSFFGNKLVSIARTSFRYKSTAMIDNIYTKKMQRRRKLATSVVSKLLDELFYEKGFEEVQLYVRKDNTTAINLYKKLGFQELKEYYNFIT